MTSKQASIIGGVLLVLILYWWTIELLGPGFDGSPPWIFLDYLNLLIHEAGHWLFLPLGQTMSILGGSLLQCLLPSLFAGYFAYKKDWLGLGFGVWWVGNNLINVSYYIADAQAQALPLLGGDKAGHDWYNLLFRWDLLHHDQLMASCVYSLGWLLLVGSLIGMILVIFGHIAVSRQQASR